MPADPFDTLGLPPTFDLDPDAIARAFLTKAAHVHPDLSADDAAADQTADLNRARATLADPERRAIALLARLAGGSEQSKSLPDGFLIEMMKVRQEAEADLAGGGEARAKWRSWTAERRADYAIRVSALFGELAMRTDAAGRAEFIAALRRVLNAWRYIERMSEQLDPEYDPARADW